MAKESKHNESEQPRRIPSPFYQRFNIEFGAQEARQRFLNRVSNTVPAYMVTIKRHVDSLILWKLANKLGMIFNPNDDFDDYLGSDFYSTLETLEATHDVLPDDQKSGFADIVKSIISESEAHLGVQWRGGVFYKSGAKLLDEELVNEPLHWLSDPKYCNVLAPFQKGLSHFLEANKHPERLADTITDMYEALEALARVVTGRPKRDLSGNAELFVKKLGLSDYYKKMLKDYISYANEFRHALEEGKQRVPPLPQEVEAFIYTTGLFIRLAIQRVNAQKSISP